MSRLTVRLPESLHRQLAAQADREGTSLNQFIVYCLTKAATASDVERQREVFGGLLHQFQESEAEEALRDLLESREPA